MVTAVYELAFFILLFSVMCDKYMIRQMIRRQNAALTFILDFLLKGAVSCPEPKQSYFVIAKFRDCLSAVH